MKYVTDEIVNQCKVELEEREGGAAIHVGEWTLGMLRNDGVFERFFFHDYQANEVGIKLDSQGYVVVEDE